ncbi:MAG: ATP-dependent Clp protease proteolytic subunit [Candidatus Latescibacteria bacterium]|nr:ATP-dependent Clp protease proteolytic subunit [Candidatus Latescibacterota bacterium]
MDVRLEEEEEKKEEDIISELQSKNLELSLFKARKVFLWGEVDYDSARSVVTRLLALEVEDPNKEIVLYVNSPGGSLYDGLAIYDAMQAVQAPVSTVTVGMAASAGALVLTGGAKGRRFAWPHARIMIHQPLMGGQYVGSASDIEIHAQEFLRSRELVNQILADHSGQSLEQMEKDTDRNNWMSAQEAVDYGLIDGIIKTMSPALNGQS